MDQAGSKQLSCLECRWGMCSPIEMLSPKPKGLNLLPLSCFDDMDAATSTGRLSFLL